MEVESGQEVVGRKLVEVASKLEEEMRQLVVEVVVTEQVVRAMGWLISVVVELISLAQEQVLMIDLA